MNISVIIPTYNRRETLTRALNSVYAQTLSPYEVLVIDDGSTDGTGELVQQLYPQCHYIYSENGGVSHARNIGIRQSCGEWIALLDSDDEWLPGKLAAQAEALERAPECRLCHTEEIWIRDGVRVNQMKKHTKCGGWIFKKCLPLCAISPSATMLKRTLLDEVGLFDEEMIVCEDYNLWLRICSQEPVAYVEQPQIIKYGGHEDQLSRQLWGMDRFRITALEKIIALGRLKDEDRQAAIKMLTKKARIMANGAEKRGKHERATHYRDLIQQYEKCPLK
ncbi:MAG: glycosyltransferase family 2 protein [Candidatus Polarisedimenticolaceae bacterium]|nr:glycosyltransferase family 2 protein [Candidatus Polarisedimenticolaceae bacterium]